MMYASPTLCGEQVLQDMICQIDSSLCVTLSRLRMVQVLLKTTHLSTHCCPSALHFGG